MKQYRKIKSKYPDMVLLFRMGDFFETFDSDALITSKVLGITLTKRSNGAAADVPLAGFPHHALDTYLPKLIKAGYRVAVCEQLEDPKFAKGIVKRDVIEVVTPGANFSDRVLNQKSNNFLAAIYLKDEKCGFAFCDVTTGEFSTSEMSVAQLASQVETINPTEILVQKRDKERVYKLLGVNPEKDFNPENKKYIFTKVDDWVFTLDYAKEILTNKFNTHSLQGFGIEDLDYAVIAAGAILDYLNQTQKNNISHINRISRYDYSDYIILDPSTKRNLEITSSINEGSREGTLISVIDRTQTSMGARLIKKWISRPLKKYETIINRQNAVEEFYADKGLRKKLAESLHSIADLERILSKISTGKAVPRDIMQLKISLKKLNEVKTQLAGSDVPTLKNLSDSLVPIPDVIDEIEKVINDNYLEGIDKYGVINKGFNSELDELKDIHINGKTWIEHFQSRERNRTGINSLKVDFNKVFGYYIEVTKANLDKVPQDYVRKQTLVNNERYITEELKEYEDKIFNAEEKISILENKIFSDLREFILRYTDTVQKDAVTIAVIDALAGFAEVAEMYGYIKPLITKDKKIEIKGGRHPVIERLLPAGEKYIPNDTNLDTEENQIIILTGPNMSGKSSYLRQTGLIVLLAQIGSFVPADEATIGIVDKIFTRVGASDNISRGESTFLVEMNEAANILNNATENSLLLLDEIGRGTSTYDGISIAWAITEYLHENPGVRAKTLFATHYHELNALAGIYPRIKNYRVEVREVNDKVIFLRNITEGTADHSYGIQVAQMAGLPEAVTNRAKEILRSFEEKDRKNRAKDDLQFSLFEYTLDEKFREMLGKIDTNNITPMDALNIIIKLKEELDK